MASHSLVCPFLDPDVKYALGVEFGMLFEQIKTLPVIRDFFCLENQEQITLLLDRAGWEVTNMRIYNEQWFWLEARRQ